MRDASRAGLSGAHCHYGQQDRNRGERPRIARIDTVVQGRPLSEAGHAGEVAINESLARALFGNADPIGRQLAMNPKEPMLTIPTASKKPGPANANVHLVPAAASPRSVRSRSLPSTQSAR